MPLPTPPWLTSVAAYGCDPNGDGAPTHSLNSRDLKELSSLGYKLDKFTSSLGRIWDHLQSHSATYARWGRVAGATKPAGDTQDGMFAVSIQTDAAGYHVEAIITDPESTRKLGARWQQLDPAAPRQLSISTAQSRDSPRSAWLALLRLSPLRDLWDQCLRRATVDTLQSVLPDAWIVDPAPLPAGSVIPRLEISSWQELPRLRHTGRSFLLRGASGAYPPTPLTYAQSEADWRAALRKAQQDFPTSPQTLVENAAEPATHGPRIIAFYEKAEQRVNALGFMALIPDGAGKLIPTRLAAA